jgi:hypothetical protein
VSTLFERLAGVAPTIDPPADAGLAELPDDAPKGTNAARILAGQQLHELRTLQQTMTELAARLQGFLTNNVLAWGVFTLDGSGQSFQQFKAECGAVTIRNLGANAMTVMQGNPTSAATSGRGVWIVPGNTKDTVPINTAEFTIYGTAADKFDLCAYTRGITPGT